MAWQCLMYLIDTNIWLERLLDQAQAPAVGQFLAQTPTDTLFLTDFALHSLAVILLRLKQPEVWRMFLQDTMIQGRVGVLSLTSDELVPLHAVMTQHGLDFDDAYQYAVAERDALTLVSFDTDFDRTPRGRKIPADLL